MNEKVLNEARKLVAGYLKRRRKELGLTQAELAEKIGIHEKTVARIESARFWISMKLFFKIVNALDLFFFVAEKESKDDIATLMRERWGKITKN